jgi:quercetin dioxygenase-like cupin family protein
MRHPKLLPIALVALFIGCAAEEGEEPAAEEYLDAVAADPGHYTVEFENDAIRLLRVSYGAGESSVMHTHPAHCAVELTAGSWEMTDPEGVVTELPIGAGETACVEAGAHLPRNAGDETADVIVVEFKEGATAGSATFEHPDAVTADPDHYSVEFENDVARLLRIRYGAGETSVMHNHPANCAIFLGDMPTTFELPDGEIIEVAETALGQLQCTDAEAHLPTNVGEETGELVLLELKGRAAFQN